MGKCCWVLFWWTTKTRFQGKVPVKANLARTRKHYNKLFKFNVALMAKKWLSMLKTPIKVRSMICES